jgi:hypothetical protein
MTPEDGVEALRRAFSFIDGTVEPWHDHAYRSEAETAIRILDVPRHHVLVRVAPEILEHLKTGDVEPVVILGVQEAGDGTYDMTLKTPESHHP